MSTLVLLLATSTVGVDIGWQPLEAGGFEYIIQIEPQLFDALRRGQDIGGDVPADIARNIRSFRVTLGTGRAPRIGDPAVAPIPSPPAHASETANPKEAVQQPPEQSLRSEGTPTEAPPPAERGGLDDRLGPRYPPENTRSQSNPHNGDTPPFLANNAPTAQPQTFEADPSSQPIVNHAAGFRDEGRQRYGVAPTGPVSNSFANTNANAASKPPAKSSSGSKPATPAESEETARPWFPFTMAMMGLFISLGGNMYLGTLAWNYRSRCTALLGRTAGGSRLARRPHARFLEEDEDQDVKAVEDDA